MNVTLKTVQIEKIDLKEIGDSIAHYDLQAGKRDGSDLTEVGSADANLSNIASPFGVQKASFYRAGVTFTTNSTYPDGLFFTLSLVSTDKNNPFTKTVFTGNAFVLKRGEDTLYADILIPDDLPAGTYLLIAKVSNDQLDKLVDEQQTINEIPQIGAVYVDIGDSTQGRRGYVLDINTTRNMDLIYTRSGHLPFSQNNYIQHESGKGRLLFSNVGTSPVTAAISANLRLPNGKTVALGLLNPNTKTIEKSVVLPLPAAHELTYNDLTNVIDISNIQIAKRARPNPDLSQTPKVEEELKNVQAIQQHAFIPLAQNKAAKWEKRYSVTLHYYIPKDDYKTVLDNAADLTRDFTITPTQATVEWQVRFYDSQDSQTAADNAKLFKIESGGSSLAGLVTLKDNSWLTDQIHPIDAALINDSTSAYVFSGDEYMTINPDTGEFTGDWKKTTELHEGGPILLNNSFGAAVHLGLSTYLFYKDSEKYLTYNIGKKDTALNVGLIKDLDSPYMRAHDKDGNVISVGECLNAHLDVTKIDAAFRDGKDAYFIAGDNYVQYAWNKDEIDYECRFGKVSDKEEWKSASASGLPITAALSDYKSERGRLRFYLNGFNSVVFLNKPDIFKDEHNGFDQELGDSDIASLKLDLGYGVQSRWVVPGVHGYANADLDLYLFGHPLKLFEAKAEAYGNVGKLHPYLDEGSVTATAKSGTLLHLEMMGYVFANDNKIATATVTAKLDPGSVQQSAGRGVIPKPKFDETLTKMEWHTTYEVFNVRMPAGPIMLSVTGGIDGNMSLGTPIALEDQPENLYESVSVKPYVHADMGAYMTGGVNYEVTKAGVKGDIRVAEAEIGGELKAKLYFNAQETSIDFNVTAKIAGELRLIKAALSLYAGTRTHIEWCSSWGIPYPCGLGWDVWDIPVYESPWLYNYEPTLLDTTLVGLEIPLK